MVRFKLSKIAAVTAGEPQGGSDIMITGITIDSRLVDSGDLFIAIRGEHFDGHNFISQALAGGAAAVLVDDRLKIPSGIPAVLVRNTLEALGEIAKAHRSRYHVPVIGITGSNGKTSTKDLVASVFEQARTVVKTEGNFNNEVGLPLTLLRISETTEIAVVEMGMRGLGQIRRLAEICRPNIGIVTNVGLTHLEILGDQANIARAKAELIEFLPPDGLAILNGDDPLVRQMQNQTNARSILYGIESKGLNYRAGEIKILNNGSQFKVYTDKEIMDIFLAVPGKHNIYNALAAIALARETGIGTGMIKKALAKSQITGKRLKIIKAGNYRVIDDTYNASPASVQAALDVLGEMSCGHRKIVVLADMLELGPDAARLHREIGEYAHGKGVESLLAFGDLAREYVAGFKSIDSGAAEYFSDKAELIFRLKGLLEPGDLVLVKGSRSMKMEEVVAALAMEEEASCRNI